VVRLRAGVIGAGFIGTAHIEALRRLGNVDVVALADDSRESAEAKAKALYIPRAYGAWQELIDDLQVDVVHNCTPNYLHFAIAMAAIRAGKAIVAEKPLGITSEETRKLWDAAKQAGVVNVVVFNYRGYPMVQQARAMIRAGDAGEVRLVHGFYLQDWLLLDTDYNWRVDPKLGGRSCAMADIGSHWIDLAQYVTGLRIEALCSDISTFVQSRRPSAARTESGPGDRDAGPQPELRVEVEDSGGLLLRFAGGAQGNAIISQVAAGHKNDLRIEIHGSRQSLAWSQEEPNTLWIGRREAANSLLPKDPNLLSPAARRFAHYPGGHGEAYPDGLKNLFLNVYRAIESDRPPAEDLADFPTFRDGHRAMLVIEAVLESAKGCGWVSVPLE